MVKQLYIHQSNQLDSLVTRLKHLYLMNKVPFQAESIVVHTQGIEQYIKKQLSKHLGIVANLDFKRPGAFFWAVAEQCMPELQHTSSLFKSDIMTWTILALFQSNNFKQNYPNIHENTYVYLSKHHVNAYNLASELATLFNHYMVYRPGWIEAWSNNQLIDNIHGTDQVWQKDLWLYLMRELNREHRVSVWVQLKNILQQSKLPNNIQLPNKINLFSVASLAPLYLELVDLLSLHIPVHLFILSPCQEYWADTQLEHPLLESCGHQGRDFFKILLNYSYGQGEILYRSNQEEVKKLNLLQIIQDDILKLNDPSNISTVFNTSEALLQDNSIQIHSAHSPVRELQILKNQLIQYIERYPDTKLEEIAVLSPDIERYLPYIDGIFSEYAGDEITLTYSICGVKTTSDKPYYTAIAAILEFIAGRFEVDSVVNLLNNKLIRAQFNITASELNIIISILQQLNISWGLDESHRQSYRAQGDQFTWKKGLQNLKSLLDNDRSESLLFNFNKFCLAVVPHTEDMELTKTQITTTANKLLDFIKTLSTVYKINHKQPTSIPIWIKRLQDTSLQLIKITTDTETNQADFLEQLIQLNKNTALAKFEHNINYSTFKYIIQSFIDTGSNTALSNQGIAFGSVMPMRTIPFKFVALIGLDERAFPRKNKRLSFDLIQKNKQIGDLSRREDDRYLFLETLISTQKTLYLSFVGRSIEKNEALNPSSLVYELIDLVARMTGIESQTLLDKWVIKHPLQNFSKHYFGATASVRNYQIKYMKAYTNHTNTQHKFLGNYSAHKKINSDVTLAELLKFWRNPARYWLTNTLAINPPWLEQKILFNESFSLLESSKQNRYNATSKNLNDKGKLIVRVLLDTMIQNKSTSQLRQELYALDYLPTGKLADAWFNRITAQLQNFLDTRLGTEVEQQFICDLLTTPMDSLAINLRMGQINLQAQFDNIIRHQLILLNYTNKTNHHRMWVESYLQHLIYASHADTRGAYLLGLEEIVYFKPLQQDIARKYLKNWLCYMEKGINTPLPFFYKTSFGVAQKMNGKTPIKDNEIGHMQTIFDNSGEKDYLENQLLFQEQELIANHQLFLPIIKDLLVPMLQHTEITKV